MAKFAVAFAYADAGIEITLDVIDADSAYEAVKMHPLVEGLIGGDSPAPPSMEELVERLYADDNILLGVIATDAAPLVLRPRSCVS